MINHAFRCIYVHIPKTAGNSVNRAFGTAWENHKDLGRYAVEIPRETFASYYKFAIVRNPWERIFSDYNYQKKKSRPQPSKLFVFRETGEKRCFREWVETMLGDPYRYDPPSWGGEVSPGIHRWSPQVDWISIDGRIAVDRVLRMEQLEEDFPRVCQQLGVPSMQLPRCNRRLHWHYSWYYDDATRDLIATYYARDIEAFGYDFESKLVRVRQVARTCATSLISMVVQPGGAGVPQAYDFLNAMVTEVRRRPPLDRDREVISSSGDRVG